MEKKIENEKNRGGKTRSRLGLFVAGSVFLLSAVLTLSRSTDGPVEVPGIVPESAEPVTDVKVAVAMRGDLVQTLDLGGSVRAARDVELIARVAGQIMVLRAFNGKYLRAGDLLIKTDDREYRTAFERASANLLGAQIEYRTLSRSPFRGGADSIDLEEQAASARRGLEEDERAFRAGRIPKEAFLRGRRDYEARIAYCTAKREDVIASKSGLVHAREAFERARLDLAGTEIRAPFGGFVVNCSVSEGVYLRGGETVCRLVDMSHLFVDVEVLENECSRLAVGQNANISVPGIPGEVFHGSVCMMNPIVDSKSKTMTVTVGLHSDNVPSRLLRPGMYASVGLHAEIHPARLLVPHDALLMRDQRSLVFTRSDGRAHWRYVMLGEENEEFCEILSGIQEGDTVITAGHHTLADEAKVR